MKFQAQLFRATTGIQSRTDALDESRLIITFLTTLVVTEILCSFTFVLEGKTDKEIPESPRLEFLEKFLAHNFPLSDAEDNTSGMADLSLLRTLCHAAPAAAIVMVLFTKV